MGVWNTHGMVEDDELIRDAIDTLGLHAQEMESLVEHARREQWVWSQIAQYAKGQEKRKANLIAKYHGLRLEKWIDLVAIAEVEYEEEHGEFATGLDND